MKIVLDKESNMLNIQFSEKPSTESAEIELGLGKTRQIEKKIFNGI